MRGSWRRLTPSLEEDRVESSLCTNSLCCCSVSMSSPISTAESARSGSTGHTHRIVDGLCGSPLEITDPSAYCVQFARAQQAWRAAMQSNKVKSPKAKQLSRR